MSETNQSLEEIKPDEVYIIDNAETLKVIFDATRMKIIELLMGEPRNVKQLSKILNIPPTKLYYHVNMLEEHGIIRVVSTRVVSGIIEKMYQVRAHSFQLKRSLLSFGPDGDSETLDIALGSLFERTLEEIKSSLKAGLINPNKTETESPDLMLNHVISQMSPEKHGQFVARIRELIKEFDQCGDDRHTVEEPGIKFALIMAMYPVVDTTPTTGGDVETE